jgi:hypothetical protein
MRTIYQTSFEEGFYKYNGISEMRIANGWSPVYVDDPSPDHKRPEFAIKDKNIGHPEVRTGRFAQNWFMVHSRYDAAIYKQFTVTPGTLVKVSAWCMGVSNPQSGFGMTVGVDPNGGGGKDFTPYMYYGPWWSTYMSEYKDRVWKHLTQEAYVGESGVFTVFLRAKSDFAKEHAGCHWDDILVEADEEAPQNGITLDDVRTVVREELTRLEGKWSVTT